MITEKLIFKVPYEVTAFHPSDLTGGQLYLRKDQATASSWVSDIGTARNFIQATATQQPTISTNSVDYDGVNDLQKVTESNAFGSDAIGIFYFSCYYDGVNQCYLLASGDELSTNYAFVFRINVSGNVNSILINGTSGTYNLSTSDTAVVGYNYGYFRCDGVSNYFSLNGGAESIPAGDAGKWLNYVPFRDNLTLGAIIRTTTLSTTSNVNKIYYNNTALTSGEIADLNTFFSDPTNY